MDCSKKYHNPTKKFTSYFLSFKERNVIIELMYRPDILEHIGKRGITIGLTHFAISVGSKDADEKDITYKFDLLDKWKLHYYE